MVQSPPCSHGIHAVNLKPNAVYGQATVLGETSLIGTKEPCFRIIGTAGEIVINGGFDSGGSILTIDGEKPLLAEGEPGGFLNSFGPQMADFADAVLNGKPLHRTPNYVGWLATLHRTPHYVP
jgi:predicted dehydrogenase